MIDYKKLDGYEFTCTNNKTYKCVAYAVNPDLYMVHDCKGNTVNTYTLNALKLILEGRRELSYEAKNIIKTMVLQEINNEDEEWIDTYGKI